MSDLQALLYRGGRNPAQLIGGRFGELTRSMVIGFQKDSGLRPDGIVHTATWQALLQGCE